MIGSIDDVCRELRAACDGETMAIELYVRRDGRVTIRHVGSHGFTRALINADIDKDGVCPLPSVAIARYEALAALDGGGAVDDKVKRR